jgi:hypothetical protein
MGKQNKELMPVWKERKNILSKTQQVIFNVVNNCIKARGKILCRNAQTRRKREFQVFKHSIVNKYFDKIVESLYVKFAQNMKHPFHF